VPDKTNTFKSIKQPISIKRDTFDSQSSTEIDTYVYSVPYTTSSGVAMGVDG